MREEKTLRSEEHSAEPQATAPARSPEPSSLDGMASGIGNARFARMMGAAPAAPARPAWLARQASPPSTTPATPGTTPATPGTTPAADPAAIEQGVRDAERFVAAGAKTKTVTTGGGGFDGTYDPAKAEFEVSMKCKVKFEDAITGSPGSFTTAEPALAPLVTQANRLRGRRLREFLARYQWEPGATAAEKLTWCADLKAKIDSEWGGKHEFHVNKPGWEWVGAKVRVNISVTPGTNTGSDHMEIRTIKMPPGQNLYSFNGAPENAGADGVVGTADDVTGFSATGGGAAGNAHDQTMLMASTDIAARPESQNSLRESMFFDTNVHDLSAAQKTRLRGWSITFQGAAGPAGLNMPVQVTGHASALGSDTANQALSERRVNSVVTELRDVLHFRNVASRVASRGEGEAGAGPGNRAQDRRVDIVVGDGQAQNLAVHEFGHAFGLGDEYAVDPGGDITGTGGTTGSATSHDPLTRAMQDETGRALPGAVAENTDSIMSLGNVIRPQHYSTFHAALTEITAPDAQPWALGPPHPKPNMSTPTGPGTAPSTPASGVP